MGTIKPIEKCDDDRVKRQIEKENDTFNKIKRWLFLGCASAFVVFLIHRPLGIWSSPIDEDLLGTYGDFVGGVIGTLITLYSVYLLVKTLNNQIEVNSNIVKTNAETLNAAKQQIKQTDQNLFDSKFNAYLKAYQDAINGYTSSDCSGKECLDAIITEFRSSGFKNEVQYLGRTQAAVKEFEGLYAKNRTVMSTHLRTLFLLMQLIADKGNIENEDRVAYAKCIRGQLSEGEMFVIRYNCYTEYGHNMQKYVNRYNLLKHLPTMSLLEFNKWRSIVETHPGYVNTVDAFFQRLRKEIGELLISMDENEGENKIREIQVSKDYTVFLEFADENKYYSFKLLRFLQNSRYGYAGKPDIDKALNCYSIGELRQMMLDFHQEFFFCNNFSVYNGDNGGQRTKAKISSSKDSSPETEVIICKLESDYPIVLKNMQLESPN